MYSGKTFRLKESILGIEDQEPHRTAVMIPAGEVIRVLRGPSSDDQRLVDIMWGTHNLVVFTEDLESRGNEVNQAKSRAV